MSFPFSLFLLKLSIIQKLLGFTAVKPIVTVYSFLQERGALNVLSDKYIETATHEIIPKKTTSREAIQREIKKKERAVKLISKKYSREGVSEDELVNCLYSIGEYHWFAAIIFNIFSHH